jgi:hypothetical protein
MAGPDDVSFELTRALGAFLESLREGRDSLTSLGWLADEIAQQLQLAEIETRKERLASGETDPVVAERFLTAADRMEMALRIAFHYLVVIPSMWIHVQSYWADKLPHGIVLYPADSDAPWLSEVSVDDVHRASNIISELVHRLHERFPSQVPIYSWLTQSEERDGH